ncbi:DUF2085 domain-containing protein [Candidatus Thorarchaeota archaeon]|nr:MAG: DUF2085 domain-containing protein [Candidatus Thorarchaeota archaeon]
MIEDQEKVLHEDELDPTTLEWHRSNDIKEGIHMLLSHHPPSLYGHCLRVSFMGRSLYLCGRCTGIYGGLGFGIVFLILLNISLTPSWFWFLLSVVLGFSTVVDWMSQRLTPRKTTNHVRAITGFFSGFGLAVIFLLGDLLYMMVTLAIMAGSVGIVGIVENRRRITSLEAHRIQLETEDEEDDT